MRKHPNKVDLWPRLLLTSANYGEFKRLSTPTCQIATPASKYFTTGSQIVNGKRHQSGFKVTRPRPCRNSRHPAHPTRPEPCSDVRYQHGWRRLFFVCLYEQIDIVDNHPDPTAKRAREVETAAGGGAAII